MSSTPKFLLDENIPKLVKKFLDSRGYFSEYAPKGTFNGELAALALKKKHVLLSRDKDFTDPVRFPAKQFSGIVVFRIHPPVAGRLIDKLSSLLDDVKDFRGKRFTVREDETEVE